MISKKCLSATPTRGRTRPAAVRAAVIMTIITISGGRGKKGHLRIAKKISPHSFRNACMNILQARRNCPTCRHHGAFPYFIASKFGSGFSIVVSLHCSTSNNNRPVSKREKKPGRRGVVNSEIGLHCYTPCPIPLFQSTYEGLERTGKIGMGIGGRI